MAIPSEEAIIEGEVINALALQKDLQLAETELMENPTFRKFLELQKTVNETMDRTWKNVEAQMIEHNVKSVKGDWGSLTIAERLNWDYDIEELPKKFIKRTVDTKKLSDTYKLERKEIKGATPRYTKYLTKRLK